MPHRVARATDRDAGTPYSGHAIQYVHLASAAILGFALCAHVSVTKTSPGKRRNADEAQPVTDVEWPERKRVSARGIRYTQIMEPWAGQETGRPLDMGHSLDKTAATATSSAHDASGSVRLFALTARIAGNVFSRPGFRPISIQSIRMRS